MQQAMAAGQPASAVARREQRIHLRLSSGKARRSQPAEQAPVPAIQPIAGFARPYQTRLDFSQALHGAVAQTFVGPEGRNIFAPLAYQARPGAHPQVPFADRKSVV